MVQNRQGYVGAFWLRTIVLFLTVLAILLGVSAVTTIETTESVMASSSVGGNDYPWPNANMNSLSPLKFNYRNCTDYAAYEINEQMGGNTSNNIKFSWSNINYKGDGNAEAWKNGATGKWPVDTKPAIGSVAWWAAASNNHYLGHVAIVSSVSNNGNTIVVDEYNLKGTGVYGTRQLTYNVTDWPNDFIHIADIAPGGTGWPGVGSATFLGSDHLNPGQVMRSSQYILSGNVQYVLIMQSDGNLVEYHYQSAVWANGKNGNPGAYLGVQSDGNIVEYTASGSPIWATNTNGQSLAYLVMQSDGNLVAYNTSNPPAPIWANNKGGNANHSYVGSDRLYNGQTMAGDYFLRSGDLRYALLMQSDGNLVLFGPGYHKLWATGTSGNPGAYLGLQGDGNMVVYSSSGHALWASNTGGQSLSYLVMQTDGNLVAYNTNNAPIWATNTSGEI